MNYPFSVSLRIKLAPSWEGMAAGEIRATTLVMAGDGGIRR
jgi:hypothetical protein